MNELLVPESIVNELGPLSHPFPSLLVLTPFTKEGGWSRPPAISKSVAPINLKIFRVLETPLKALEMLKLSKKCLLRYHSNPSNQRCFSGKSLDFSLCETIQELIACNQASSNPSSLGKWAVCHTLDTSTAYNSCETCRETLYYKLQIE